MKHASVQATRLGIVAIQAGVIELSGGEYRAILEVNGAARPFEDDQRLEATMAGFASFLNALSYPIQVLVRATPVNLAGYVTALEERGRSMRDGRLAELAHDHALFVQSLAQQRTLLERHFYVVVPSENATHASWLQRLSSARRAVEEEPRREAARRQLTFRCEEVARQLGRCGLSARRLTDLEIAQLYSACWSPERGREQRFRQQLRDYTTLVVRAAAVAGSGESR